MLKPFNKYIKSKNLCSPSDKILIAISGGVDSMVLVKLFLDLGYNIGLAHCNFNLRGGESDLDQMLVKNLAEEKNIPFHVKAFNTIDYAKENKLSIEMAARDLRYNWFKEIIADFSYDYLATGHHSNDATETVFLNLCRGTGINGILGIPVKNNNIIRPLLFATREQIEKYAKDNSIKYRYDSSNDSIKYMRNIIRHQVIPAFRKINPAFDDTMLQNLENLNNSAFLYNQYIEILKEELIEESQSSICISIPKLRLHTPLKTLLYELIKEYNFNNTIAFDIAKNLNSQSGKVFYSKTHQLLIDREKIIIEVIIKKKESKLRFNSIEELINNDIFTRKEIQSIDKVKIERDSKLAFLDVDKIIFPLTIQAWNAGDTFQPLGMNNYKKISDFLIDSKIDRFQKQNILLLKSKKSVVWVIGHRIDNRFKITDSTKRVLILG